MKFYITKTDYLYACIYQNRSIYIYILHNIHTNDTYLKHDKINLSTTLITT